MGKTVHISSGSRVDGAFAPVNIVQVGDPSEPTEIIIQNGKIMVYDSTGQTTIDSGVVQAVGIAAKAISASKLSVGQRSYVTTVSFSPASRNSATWTSGIIYFGGGETQDIEAGTTGNLSHKSYIYYDGTEYLRTTTSESVATAGNRAIMLVVTPVDSADDLALIQEFRGGGTTISGDKITTGHISADRIWIGIQSFVTDVSFSSPNAGTASWNAGTIKFTNGTEREVNSGTTGNLNKETSAYSADGNTIALWHLNETSGNLCDNAEGTGELDAEASHSDTVNSAGEFDYCRYFNGTDNYLVVSAHSEEQTLTCKAQIT